ncbi:hypothetical protein BDB01DRAFT_833214 [Pilobolus umbonatus]|nr:hypothetical protein BDB01DRAFT_833214 [Pilobolus umbonatus]
MKYLDDQNSFHMAVSCPFIVRYGVMSGLSAGDLGRLSCDLKDTLVSDTIYFSICCQPGCFAKILEGVQNTLCSKNYMEHNSKNISPYYVFDQEYVQDVCRFALIGYFRVIIMLVLLIHCVPHHLCHHHLHYQMYRCCCLPRFFVHNFDIGLQQDQHRSNCPHTESFRAFEGRNTGFIITIDSVIINCYNYHIKIKSSRFNTNSYYVRYCNHDMKSKNIHLPRHKPWMLFQIFEADIVTEAVSACQLCIQIREPLAVSLLNTSKFFGINGTLTKKSCMQFSAI